MLLVSVDAVKDHQGWVTDINEIKNTTVDFPLIVDQNRVVSELFDMIQRHASKTTIVRSVLIIRSDKKVKLTLTYLAAIGRNFSEILRVVDALQLSAEYSISKPADCKQGDDVIVTNTISTEDAEKQFPKCLNVVEP